MKHVIVKARKINSVSGNLAYLRDTKDHPDLCYVYSTCSDELWKEYAAVNQEEFKKSGKANDPNCRCVEAREQIFILPNEMYNANKEELEKYTQEKVEELKKKYGIEALGALHGSDSDCKNMHIHFMYMEREKIAKEEKIATRRIYFNDKGRQVKSRKDAVDQEGKLLPGYYFVKKGESYGEKEWTSKKQHLHSNAFEHQIKVWWSNEINQLKNRSWGTEIEERTVYDRDTSPYFALQDEIKPFRYRDPLKQEKSNIKAYELSGEISWTNRLKRDWNDQVDQALALGAAKEDLVAKRKEMSAEIKKACEEDRKETINNIFYDGLNWIRNFLIEFEKTLNKLRERKDELRDKIKGAREEKAEKRSEKLLKHIPKKKKKEFER